LAWVSLASSEFRTRAERSLKASSVGASNVRGPLFDSSSSIPDNYKEKKFVVSKAKTMLNKILPSIDAAKKNFKIKSGGKYVFVAWFDREVILFEHNTIWY